MFWTVTMSLLEGFGTALELFTLTLVFSLPLGLVVAFLIMNKWAPFARCKQLSSSRLAQFRPVSALFNLLVWVMRGTPLMLQLFVVYYGPGLIFDNNIWGGNRMVPCVLAFVINYACYFAVIYRGGIEGVPEGQREAGEVLGMSRTQIFFKITLLQMVKRIMPPMSNEVITLVKDTSLARVIAISELIRCGERFMKNDGLIWPLFYTGVFYLVFNGLLTLLFNYLEKKMSYFKG